MTKREAIGRRYIEMQHAGKGNELYDEIRKEFGPVANSTIRSYGLYVRRKQHHVVDGYDPVAVVIKIPGKVLMKAKQLASKEKLTLDVFITQLILDKILD